MNDEIGKRFLIVRSKSLKNGIKGNVEVTKPKLDLAKFAKLMRQPKPAQLPGRMPSKITLLGGRIVSTTAGEALVTHSKNALNIHQTGDDALAKDAKFLQTEKNVKRK